MSIEFNNYDQNNLLEIKNNLNKKYPDFYIDCKNDYKKLINSFFKLLEKSNQKGGMPIKLESINKRLLNSLSKNPILPSINNFLKESSRNNKGKLQLPPINNYLNKSSRNNEGKLRSVQLPSINNFLKESSRNNKGKLQLPPINNYLNKSSRNNEGRLQLPSIKSLNESLRSINSQLSQNSTASYRRSQQSNSQKLNSNQSNNNSFTEFNLNKKQSLHECKVFAYLNKKSKKFVDNSTCFLKCVKFKTGFIGATFKQNCLGIGELSQIITLEKLIKYTHNKELLLKKIKLILDKILKKINELHLLGVANNNLICSKVTVINETNNIDIRFLDFKKASILDPSENINEVNLNELYKAYKNFIDSLVLM